jgi:hypothetical protein
MHIKYAEYGIFLLATVLPNQAVASGKSLSNPIVIIILADDLGFDSFFGCTRTHNEPPFVFVENHRMVGFDTKDPIRIIRHEDVVKRRLKDWGWGISEGAAKAHAMRPENQIDLILADRAVQWIS